MSVSLMDDVFNRLTYLDNGVPYNPLIHLFFFQTLAMGVAYVFFGGTETVMASVLFYESVKTIGGLSVSLWGVCALVLTLANTLAIYLRRGVELTAFAGFLLWLYAFIIYFAGAFYFQVIAGAIVNLIFWMWFYLRVRKYNRVTNAVVKN